ncbi:hypothetical protein B5E58_02490 [Tyzzerella sp. An114]|uniref:hypothetical protein n=1 Tax=Tyzzerella sp. An114 TaxID=1965545 RepID=UPI000B455288|nr:hypothetical protein [Tyzzerella sp. An114]OUQ59977.1 hypothetical protein B5E58_02490 [Tyzzerella sp. An114]
MRFEFTEEQKKNGINMIEIEEDELILEGEYVEGEGKNYVITGIATIEGERYHEFQVEFELVEEPSSESLEDIMETEWEWYDYLC